MGRTLKQLIECYRTDPESDFQQLHHQVRMKHRSELSRLIVQHGDTQLRDIRLRTIKVWYRGWLADGKTARARSFVNRLRELFRFGRLLLEDHECDRLFEELAKLSLENSPVRSVEMTADHAKAICKTAREHFHWPSIALAQALQFELMLSQKDVIGEWVPVGEPGQSDVVTQGKKWLRGLRWENLNEQLILQHRAGSGGRLIKADLKTAPMVLEELKLIAEDALSNRASLPMTGPVVLCDVTQWPWKTAEFRRKWRLVAKKARVPENVTNRDSSPTGVIRGGPERAKISQTYSLKRIDYSLRMARRKVNKTGSS